MTSISQKGHNKNVATFGRLISLVTSFGSAYNPSQENLKIPNLVNAHVLGRESLQAQIVTNIAESNAITKRNLVFSGLKKLSTRIKSALFATGAADQTKNQARSIHRKIQGIKASTSNKVVKDENGVEPLRHSSSQQGFDDHIEQLSEFIQLLSTESQYFPNEHDLMIDSLNTLLDDMITQNNSAIDAESANAVARIERNIVLYIGPTGLKTIFDQTKNYVKSVFGPTSEEYKKCAKLQFVDYKRLK